MSEIEVRFFEDHPAVRLPRGARLSERLTPENSPILFGCRTGICATCLIVLEGAVPPPDEDEIELLEVMAPGDARARLACQVDLQADVRIGRHPGSAP